MAHALDQTAMMNNTEELKDRVNAKKHELQAKLSELKADARAEARETRTKLQSKLDELEEDLKEGWEKVSETTAAKLNRWLERD
jgi:DNA-binding transcriptional MerR regulator